MSRLRHRPTCWLLGLFVIASAGCQKCQSGSSGAAPRGAARAESLSPGVPFARDLAPREVYAHEAVVLATGTAGAAAFLLDAGSQARRVWRIPPTETQAARDTHKEYVLVGGLVVGISAQPGVIEAMDPRTGASAWRTAAFSPQVRPAITAFAEVGSVVVLALQEFSLEGPAREELIAFRTKQGELAWRADGPVAALAGDSSGALVLSPDGTLTLREGESGRTRWSVRGLEADGAQVALLAGYALVAQAQGQIARIEVLSGARTEDVGLGGMLAHTIAKGADGRTLFVLAARPSASGPWEAMLVAVDVASGRERWRGERLGTVHQVGARVGASLDTVYMCIGGTLIACDAATGRQRWSWGTGRCGSLALWRAAPDGPSVPLMATWWPPSGDGSLGVLPFVPGGGLVQAERVSVEGQVRHDGSPGAGWHVQVGTTVVTADADGRYHASLEQRGALMVEPALPHSDDNAAPVVLPLDGRGHYVVDLEVVHNDPDSAH